MVSIQKSIVKEMSKNSEQKLWEEYKKTHDPNIRDTFVTQYYNLIKYVAGKVAMGMPQNIEYDDLVGYGVFGLLDAIEKYDPSRNIKFKTYAVTRIRGAIYDQLRAIDWVPISIRQKAKEVEEVIAKLENKLGYAPSDVEIALEMGITLHEFHQILMKLSGTSLISINDAWFTGDDNDKVSILETLVSDNRYEPDNQTMREANIKLLYKALEDLPKKEKTLILLYYLEDLTLKEIGVCFGVTESRMSQLHTKAIMRLKAHFEYHKDLNLED